MILISPRTLNISQTSCDVWSGTYLIKRCKGIITELLIMN